jgi:hypothetical protein
MAGAEEENLLSTFRKHIILKILASYTKIYL